MVAKDQEEPRTVSVGRALHLGKLLFCLLLRVHVFDRKALARSDQLGIVKISLASIAVDYRTVRSTPLGLRLFSLHFPVEGKSKEPKPQLEEALLLPHRNLLGTVLLQLGSWSPPIPVSWPRSAT